MKMKKNAMAKSMRRDHSQNRSSCGEAPLAWWRTIPAKELDLSRVKIMRATLSTIVVMKEPTWRAAADGNAAAAVGLALRLNPARSTETAYDLLMTAVVCCAAEGDAAAALTMSHVLRRLPMAGRKEARIATSWLVRTFSAATERSGLGKGGWS
jgi:hypothetical protein